MSGHLFSRDRDGRGALHFSKFGPDHMPIVRTQVPTHYRSLNSRFNGGAVFDWNTSCSPITQLVGLHLYEFGEFGEPASPFNGSI